MGGYRSISFTGKIISATSPSHLVFEGTNDEDATSANRDWVFMYGLRVDQNTTASGIVVSGTGTYFMDFEGLNVKYVRARFTPGTATNTFILKSRRVY
jgi:hypothetical protein